MRERKILRHTRCCDPELDIWFLRWNAYAVAHLSNPFFTNHLDYPSGVKLSS